MLAARIGLVDVLREGRAEGAERAELAGAGARDHLHRAGLVVQAVGDHQLGATGFLRRQDLLALGEARRHRLLEPHVDAGFQRRDGVLRVQDVRRRDVDRIDVARGEQCRILRVGNALIP